MSNQMRFPNNPNNRSEILLNENITQLTKVANCVDTGTNLLKVDIEDATISVEGTNLATKENQQTIIDATLRDINNTGSIGDGSSQATSLVMGYDRTNGKGRSILVDSGGRQDVNIIGNTEGDGSGTAHNIHVDGSGNLLTSIVSSVNIIPANSVNSGITDDPANSMAVGVRCRSDPADASTEIFMKCDGNGVILNDPSKEGLVVANGTTSALHTMMLGNSDGTNLRTVKVDSDGHLQVDVLSGAGGGDATAANQTTMITRLTDIETNTQEVADALYTDGSSIGVSDKGILVMGRNGTNAARPIHITNNGDVEVEIADFVKGQDIMADSFPVVIASDQSAVPVSGTITETNSADSLTKLTEIDNAVDGMSAKLPATLGQKANASSLSICRSSTTGAFDMSARTTIGTASTSTKLLCDSAGKLSVNATQSGIAFSSELTIMNNVAIGSGVTTDSSEAQVGSITIANPQPTFSVSATVNDFDVKLLCSQDGTNFDEYDGIFNANSPKVFGLDDFGAPTVEYYKISITNKSVGSANYTVKAGGLGLTMSAP